jgi:hypothetical protein
MKQKLRYSSITILFILFISVAFGQLPVYSWANAFGNASGGNDNGSSIATDASGNTYVLGNYHGTVDFDPSASTQSLTAVEGTDVFIAKYDASGNYVWAISISGTSEESAKSIALDASGNIYVMGNFYGTVDFDASGPAVPLTAVFYDMYIAKYSNTGGYIWAKNIGNVTGAAIALDGSGNVHVTGRFSGTSDFDPSAGTANLIATDGFDAFFAKYTTAGVYVWAKSVDGGTSFVMGDALTVDGTGNVYVAGHFNGTADFDPSAAIVNLVSAGNYDVFIAKYNSAGTYVWAKRIGGAGEDSPGAIALDASANVYITGYYYGVADFDPAAAVVNLTSLGISDVFIAKYSTAGLYTWAKSMGGSGLEQGGALKTDGTGNVYVSGIFNGTADFDPSAGTANLTPAGNYDIFFAKYTTAGVYVWSKSIGGIDQDVNSSLALDGSGNVFVSGHFYSTGDFDPSASVVTLNSVTEQSMFVGKYTNLGVYTVAWAARDFEGGYGRAMATITDPAGNVYMTGSYRDKVDFDPSASTAYLTNLNGDNIFLAKYDAAGNYLWAIQLGSNNNNDEGTLLTLDALGNIYVAGIFDGTVDFDPSASTADLTSLGANDDVFIAKYNASGNYIWARNIGSAGQPYITDMEVDANGDLLFSGAFWGTVDFDPSAANVNVTSIGSQDAYIAKFNLSGNYVWVKNIGGAGAEAIGMSLDVDETGNIVVAGHYRTTVDFDPSAATMNLTALGGDDIFIAKYNGSGNFIWVKSMGGTAFDRGASVERDATGNLFLTGTFSGTVDFDPSAAVANITGLSGGTTDVYIAKYDSTGNYIWAKAVGGTNSDLVYSSALDAAGNILITGSFYGTADFDPSAATVNFTAASVGQTDAFIAKYSASGNYLWASSLGGTANDDGYGVGMGTGGVVYFAGAFNKTIDFDPSASTATITAQSNLRDIYLAKYMHCAATTASTSVTACSTYTLNAQTYTASGAYVQTLVNAAGCDSVLTINLTIINVLLSASQTNVSCNGGANGTATIVPSGGGLPYSYAWSPSGGAGATASGLAAGTYTVTVADANTCTATSIVTITAPTALIVNVAASAVTCNGLCNGTATATVTGGTPGYSYLWTPGGFVTPTASGLCAGSYTVAVTDANGCVATSSFTISQPAAITIAQAQTAISCNGGANATATATASGGTGAFTYSWAPTGGTGSTATGLTVGAYTVTATDANACTATSTFTISQPAAITIAQAQTAVSCNGGANATATATASGGTGAFIYSWAPTGGTGSTATGLTAGAYTVTATDANGCTATSTYTISQPSAIIVSVATTAVTCNSLCDGTAMATTTGGTPGYTYLWMPSTQTAPIASGLCAGSYSVVATDANGCTATSSFTISQPSLLTASASATTVLCNGGTSFVSVTPSGGTSPYSFIGAPSFTVPAGSYTYNISDGSGCTASVSITIAQPAAITSTQSFTVCAGGAVTVGASTYTASGTYTNVFTAFNTCDSTVTTNLTVNPPIDITTSTSGSALAATATGAAYQWLDCNNGNAIITGETAGTYTATTGGNYAVSITENGCVDTSACVSIVLTGIQSNEAAVNLILYPNPNDGAFIIQTNAEGSYSIVNELGQLVRSVDLNASNNYTSSVSDLNNGVYFIFGVNNNQMIKQKIVVIR